MANIKALLESIKTMLAERNKLNDRIPKAPWYKSIFNFMPLPGRVSRIHQYEARERYCTLWRMLQYYAALENIDIKGERAFEILQKEAQKSGPDKQKRLAIVNCHATLKNIARYLTRKQGDLNIVWRDMTRVRANLLEHVMEPQKLPCELYFCREEAYRLAVTENPEVKDMLQRLAEIMDEKGLMNPVDERKFKHLTRALLEHFNTIRTGRIHQQYINIRNYLYDFVALMVVTLFIIGKSEIILKKDAVALAANKALSPNLELLSLSSIKKYARYVFGHNILAFIFVGGLTGGLFSVAIRERPRDRVPGEDAYFSIYVLTKPFIGATGAVILYVLLVGGFATPEIMKGVKQLDTVGIYSFGFAFISGFSERVIFPNFR